MASFALCLPVPARERRMTRAPRKSPVKDSEPRMDYRNVIDAATWNFIRRTEAHYPPETATYSIDRQREIYDRMCREFFQGYPPGVTARDEPIAGVPCRIYPGAGPATVLYLHGGGWVVGGLESHDDVCAEIRARTGLTVVSADYRLSPEHLHPAGFDDVCAVACALPGPVVIAGDSAGGNLAAAASHALRGKARIIGQVLTYPGLGGDMDAGSYITHAHAPMLTREDLMFYKDIRHGGPAPLDDPTVAPLRDPDFTGLPLTLAVSAECDPEADDARDYAAKVNAAGGRAHWSNAQGLPHGYLRARTTVPRAAASFTLMIETIAAFARGEWPFEEPT
jgi:acetyl esterase